MLTSNYAKEIVLNRLEELKLKVGDMFYICEDKKCKQVNLTGLYERFVTLEVQPPPGSVSNAYSTSIEYVDFIKENPIDIKLDCELSANQKASRIDVAFES